MIIVKDKTIMTSKGQTFTTLFEMDKSGYVLDGSETIKLNIKRNPEDTDILLTLPCGIDTLNNIISVYGTKEEMSVLPAGTYFYDILMTLTSGARYTLLYPSKLIVREVCYE